MSQELLERIIAADEKRKQQESNQPAPENKVENSSSENVEVKSGDDPGSDSNEIAETSKNENGDKNKSETPNDNQQTKNKVDKSKIGEKEKMEYSFRKQFARQEGKYRSQLEQMQKELEELKKGIKKPEITRDNFESEEAYLDWKLEQKTNSLFEQQKKKDLESQIEQQKLQEKQIEIQNRAKSIYESKEDIKLYNDMVRYAAAEGYDAAFEHENGKDILKFIEDSPIGPRILQHLIGFKEKFIQIFNMQDPARKKVELIFLEKELMYDIQAKKNKNQATNIDNKDLKQTKPNIPVIGKLGQNNDGNNNKLSKQEEERELMRIIRGR